MPFKSLLCSVALLVLGWVLPAPAASSGSAKPKPPEPTGNRYLFIVENSSAMERRDESTRQTVFEFINTGLRGRMLPGDTFGVWTFNSQPETRFPMQVWDSSTRLDSATRVNIFLKDLGYHKRGNFERVWRDLQAVVASVNELTVVLVTDGSDRITGTPFDREINNTYRELGNELSTKKQPFITAFVMREGSCVAFSVTHPGEALVLPAPSEKARVRPATLARTENNSSSEEPAKSTPSTNTLPRRVPAIIVTRESVARENDPIGPSHATTPTPPAPIPTASTATPQTTPAAVPPVALPASNPPTAPTAATTTVSTSQLTAVSAPITAVSQPVSLPSPPTPTAPPVKAASLQPPALPTPKKPAPVPVAASSVVAATASVAPTAVPANGALTPLQAPDPTALPIPKLSPIPTQSQPTPASSSLNATSSPTLTGVTATRSQVSAAPVSSAIVPGQGGAVSVQARGSATMEPAAATPASSAAVATAPLRANEGSGLGSNTKLVLASLMLVGAMGCFWVHQQRARKTRQSSFISRALPRAPAPASQAKR